VNKANIELAGTGDGVVIQNPGGVNNGITVRNEGNGFVVRNVTVKNFLRNGVFMARVDNFLLSHVTAVNNGEYGLFPVRCHNGKIEHCIATGHDDTGIYIGQSSNVELSYNQAYGNVNGLEVENSTDVTVVKNQAYDNTAGILVVLLPGLTVKTASGVIISHNHVYNNNHVNFAEPGEFESFVPSGSGILIVGCDGTIVQDNNVSDNHFTGIATVSTVILGTLAGLPPEAFADIEPNADGTRVINNILNNNGAAPPAGLPLPGSDLIWDGSGSGNCWKENKFTSSFPSQLPICN
jgi:parallel beta-helix repeat protein